MVQVQLCLFPSAGKRKLTQKQFLQFLLTKIDVKTLNIIMKYSDFWHLLWTCLEAFLLQLETLILFLTCVFLLFSTYDHVM